MKRADLVLRVVPNPSLSVYFGKRSVRLVVILYRLSVCSQFAGAFSLHLLSVCCVPQCPWSPSSSRVLGKTQVPQSSHLGPTPERAVGLVSRPGWPEWQGGPNRKAGQTQGWAVFPGDREFKPLPPPFLPHALGVEGQSASDFSLAGYQRRARRKGSACGCSGDALVVEALPAILSGPQPVSVDPCRGHGLYSFALVE